MLFLITCSPFVCVTWFTVTPTPSDGAAVCFRRLSFCVIITCVTDPHCAFSILAVLQRPLSAGAGRAGAAAPSSGEKLHLPVQPAAADDQRQTERWPAAGGKLQGEAHISPEAWGGSSDLI